MPTEQFDLVILGSGSTAFAAAIKAAELGKTAVMTESRTLGGTCVNRGCLPSKDLIEAARIYWEAEHPRFPGLAPVALGLNFKELIAGKDEVIRGYRDRKYQSILDDSDKIEVLQRASRILPDHEPEVSTALSEALEDEGLDIRTSAKIVGVEPDGEGVVVTFERQGWRQTGRSDRLLVATGRRPNTDDIAIDRAGVTLDEQGFVKIDEYLRTTVAHIWAAGDVVGPRPRSHMATPVGAHEANIAAGNALGAEQRKADHRVGPPAIFT